MTIAEVTAYLASGVTSFGLGAALVRAWLGLP